MGFGVKTDSVTDIHFSFNSSILIELEYKCTHNAGVRVPHNCETICNEILLNDLNRMA